MPDETKKAGETSPSPVSTGAKADRDTGEALRSVYQKTIDEVVPDEMMDLLSRLD